jgi:hypothetical protein
VQAPSLKLIGDYTHAAERRSQKNVRARLTLHGGYKFRITATMVSQNPAVGLAQLKGEDSEFYLQTRREARAADLLRTFADLLLDHGHRANIRLDVEEGEPIGLEQVCIVLPLEPPPFIQSVQHFQL